MAGENSVKLTDKVRKNSAVLADLSIAVAGLRGILFKNEPDKCKEASCEPKCSSCSVDEEVEYQSVLLSEIMSDLEEIERRL